MINESPVSSTPLLQANHARYLEQIDDQEFWRHAAELATPLSGDIAPVGEYLACPCPWHLVYSRAGEQPDPSGPEKVLVPLTYLREVIAAPPRFTYFPTSPLWMVGITTWHRAPLAVINLAAYLTQQQSQIHRDSFILITQHEAITLGFATSVTDIVHSFPLDHLQPYDKHLAQYEHLTNIIMGLYADAFVLDLPALLITIVEKMRTAS